MKSKILAIIALVAVFSSFAFISNVNEPVKQEPIQELQNNDGSPGGFVMEDRNSW
ncbi:MAG TPA: hypothetical protein PKC24_02745 [Cyclobacteriaceae bacterium]|mgnify:CR=1 FL=1|nr:hypothetical protein [Cyclobacteriaceae bacterium]